MLHPVRTSLILLTVLSGCIAAAPMAAEAQTKLRPPRTVQDDAGFFSAAAKAKANADIAEIKRSFKKDLLIESLNTTERPKNLDVKDKKAMADFFNKWAVQRFKNQSINGIYVVILKKPPILRVVVGNKTRDSGWFTTANREELVSIFKSQLKSDKDQALLVGAAYVKSAMARNAPGVKSATGKKTATRKSTTGQSSPGFLGNSLLGWICVGLAAILVVWLIFGLIRAFSGAGTPAAAGGNGGASGSGGSGWGAFFPSLVGGLFGAAAGMWLYNTFAGGQSASAAPQHSDAAMREMETDVGEEDASVSGADYEEEDKYGGGGDDDGGWDDGGGDGGGDWGNAGGDW